MENKNLAEKTQKILQEILQYTQEFLTQTPSQIEIDIVKDKTKQLYEILVSYNTVKTEEIIREIPEETIVVEEEIIVEPTPIIVEPVIEVVKKEITQIVEPIIEEPIVIAAPQNEAVVEPIINNVPEITIVETPIEEIPQIILETKSEIEEPTIVVEKEAITPIIEPIINTQTTTEEEAKETLISFDILNTEEPKTETIEIVQEIISPEPIIVKPIAEEIPEPVIKQTIIEVVPEPIIKVTPEPISVNAPVVEPVAPPQEIVNVNSIVEPVINEPIIKEVSTSESNIDIDKLQSILQLKNNKDLSSKLGKKPLANISSAIGINDRFRYIKEMFNNDIAQYNNAIQTINSSADLDNALRYIVSNFDWDYENNLVQSFIILVERRFLQ